LLLKHDKHLRARVAMESQTNPPIAAAVSSPPPCDVDRPKVSPHARGDDPTVPNVKDSRISITDSAPVAQRKSVFESKKSALALDVSIGESFEEESKAWEQNVPTTPRSAAGALQVREHITRLSADSYRPLALTRRLHNKYPIPPQ
jgi:hypothetical protein